jgi:hypothetical protein
MLDIGKPAAHAFMDFYECKVVPKFFNYLVWLRF